MDYAPYITDFGVYCTAISRNSAGIKISRWWFKIHVTGDLQQNFADFSCGI